jgi:hypothetical protein
MIGFVSQKHDLGTRGSGDDLGINGGYYGGQNVIGEGSGEQAQREALDGAEIGRGQGNGEVERGEARAVGERGCDPLRRRHRLPMTCGPKA